MRNNEIIEAFIEERIARNSTGSLTSTGGCLYSYQTCIAEYDKRGRLWYNKTRYSNTTSRHQYMIRAAASIYRIVDNIPRGRQHIVTPIEETIRYGRQS